MSTTSSRRGWAAATALTVALLAIYPVGRLAMLRGVDWQGSFAYLETDELAYAAYVNALVTGRPRRNNPYTADQGQPGVPLAESFVTIQFLPAYATAGIERVLRISTSATFGLLIILVALSSALVLFWLIQSVTGDEHLAAAGVLFILCFDSVPTVWGLLQYLRGLPADFSHFRFLRCYVPGMAFPFFFAFCALVWRMLTTPQRTRSFVAAALAGLVFAVLVFSYYFYWTAIIAWVACLGLLWTICKPDGWQRIVKQVVLIMTVGAAAFIPYAYLLAQRAPAQDSATMLAHTHLPDLLRVPELASAMLLVLVVLLNRCGLFHFRDRAVLFATSFLLLPFPLFNQQIITGLSLQPFHYEVFLANYTVLLASVVIAGVLFRNLRGKRRRYLNIALIGIATIAVAWLSFESTRTNPHLLSLFRIRDDATPAALRLAELGRKPSLQAFDTGGVVLATDRQVADYLPTIAPQPLLWAPHMYYFAGVTPTEDRRRLLQFMYYTGIHFEGVDARQFKALDDKKRGFFSDLIGRGRSDSMLISTWKPIGSDEYENAQRTYSDFVASFNREMATRPTLAYVLTAIDRPVGLSNLDRWYDRDNGEQIGKYILYRVKLRP